MTMTEKKAPATKAAAKAPAQKKGTTAGLSAEEKAAMKQALAEKKRTAAGQNGEKDVLAAIDSMEGSDAEIARGLHALVKEVAPDLFPRTWYGFPAYAKGPKDPVIFFWQFAGKFKSRYGTLGFNDGAALDDGAMWPAAYAITEWNDEVSKKVAALIERAIA